MVVVYNNQHLQKYNILFKTDNKKVFNLVNLVTNKEDMLPHETQMVIRKIKYFLLNKNF